MSPADPADAAEPTLDGLVRRLTAEGRLRGARLDGRAIGAAAIPPLPIADVHHDSRRIGPGGLFVAIAGDRQDGHDHAPAAVAAGAVAIVVEHPIPGLAVPQLVVADPRAALASAAAWVHGDPSQELTTIGITGTDGKTTTSYLAVSALDAAGRRPGLIGTIATRIGGVATDHDEHATTPEAPELQAALRAMVQAGDDSAVIETTSHGLALERVGSVAYDVAILTNLSHEHLELHGTFEAYRDAKLRLFERLGQGRPKRLPGGAIPPEPAAIVNLDDPSAGLFIGTARDVRARVITYGTDPAADLRATAVSEDAHGLHMAIDGLTGAASLDLQLAGRFNAHNALAVIGLGEALGLDRHAVRTGLAALQRVPGRMERLEVGQPFEVVIDFAHSPASLTTVLDLLAPMAAARGGGLIAVFGSAGERDTAKRPRMGRIAGERCRLVVVTDEDPRGEDRATILDEIARGAEAAGRRRGHDLLLIADRAQAIAAAFEAARSGDIVLLAGKGHERSIAGPDGDQPWDERAVALDALAAMGFRG
jgi:UDP-N-acetylmuramoyl-L-alanyl-D-glutamate--2,6-diaminopimelate ligase